MRNGGSEKRLSGSSLPEGEWVHVAVALGSSFSRMYLNGELVDESEDNIRPIDFKPVLNYIGKGQAAAPFFDGYLDDFRIYNYELSGEEISKLVSDINTNVGELSAASKIVFNVYPIPASDILKFKYESISNNSEASLSLYNIYGKLELQYKIRNRGDGEINVEKFPAGIYMLKLTIGEEFFTKKIIIKH